MLFLALCSKNKIVKTNISDARGRQTFFLWEEKRNTNEIKVSQIKTTNVGTTAQCTLNYENVFFSVLTLPSCSAGSEFFIHNWNPSSLRKKSCNNHLQGWEWGDWVFQTIIPFVGVNVLIENFKNGRSVKKSRPQKYSFVDPDSEAGTFSWIRDYWSGSGKNERFADKLKLNV